MPVGTTLIIPKQQPLYHAEALCGELAALLKAYMAQEEPFPLLIALQGDAGSGRGYLAGQVCARFDSALLLVDGNYPDLEELLSASELYGAAICFEKADDLAFIRQTIQRTGFAFVKLEPGQPPPYIAGCAVLPRDMPQPVQKDREAILASITDETVDLSASRLNPGQLVQLGLRIKVEKLAGRHGDTVKGEKSANSVALADLILPNELTEQLKELCAFIKARDTVFRQWGFNEKIPWGRGISALFYGAPGTGKTMAAAALARETGLNLNRVDLSQIISKYIGETQKNMAKLFTQAEKSGDILFFDEADALFSKRTETADAQDKYSNAETAYLLQRMERHDGVCILATNLLQNLDEAFRRRIGYMLHFPMPDESLREKIWRGIFPANAPVGQLDYKLLAKHFELSGAAIKNTALHAAYLAAANGCEITMDYILRGAKNEYHKQGKSINPQALQLLTL